MSIESPEKEATPFTAATVAVPPREPDPVLFPITSVIEAFEVVTVLPFESWTRTTGWVAQALPADPPEGWVWKAN